MVECRCRCLCKISEEEQHQILESFNKMGNHEVQNAYLRGCVSVVPENQQRRRPLNEDGQARKSFIYTITSSSNTTPVCKASFLGLHGIKESRLKRRVLNFEKDITDGKGHHQNHPTVGKDVKKAVRCHIIDFPARVSHYSRSKNEHKKYSG